MNWRLKPKAPEEFIKQFPEYSPVILQLLYNRGLKTQKAIDEFFNPDYEEDLHDPFLMLGMKEAVAKILKTISKKEKIVIFGDYDADGVCGAVILKEALEALGAGLSQITIPDRILDGYGLNLEAVRNFAKEGAKLIITVDCGISDFEEIELAKKLGMEVIILDHHLVQKKVPKADIIVDPWQKKDKYPFKELTGAGVAFKLVQAFIKEIKKKKNKPMNEIKDGWEKWFLDLVAIATVADCRILVGENRAFVRYGLIVLAQTKRLGLQELMKTARLKPIYEADKMKTNLDAYSLGFILSPRLNAAGRVHHANLALELLLAKTKEEAQKKAEEIENFNRQRQQITEKIVNEVENRIKSYVDNKNQPVIVEADKDWSPGVVGLVAGKIADKYNRPTFIFNINGSSARGSARSVHDFNLVEALEKCGGVLQEFGGHAEAAGAALAVKNLSVFRQKINVYAVKNLKGKDLTPILEIDVELEPGEINWPLFDDLVRFEPFGEDNPRPVFLIKNLDIKEIKSVGNNGKHLKLELKSSNPSEKIFKAIGFNHATKNGHLAPGDKVDLAFELIIDEWNGNRELQFKIIDIKKA